MGAMTATVVHLFDGPYVMVGRERRDVPEGSKHLLAFVALRRRRVERRQAAGALWSAGDEERAAGNLRSALWRLRRAGIDVLVADKWSLALETNVLVDLHALEEWASISSMSAAAAVTWSFASRSRRPTMRMRSFGSLDSSSQTRRMSAPAFSGALSGAFSGGSRGPVAMGSWSATAVTAA